MPKNLTGGKNGKKGKNNRHKMVGSEKKDDKVLQAEDTQVYGCVLGRTGGWRLRVECSDGHDRDAIIPGKFYKRVWFDKGDIILCDLEMNGEHSVCGISHKYTSREATILKSLGKIKFEVQNTDDFADTGYQFEDGNNNVLVQRTMPSLNNIDAIEKDNHEVYNKVNNQPNIKVTPKNNDDIPNKNNNHNQDTSSDSESFSSVDVDEL